MGQASNVTAIRPQNCSDDEWAARVELAATYRIFDYLGWSELIFNHITLRVPGDENHILINPYGLWYKEVTASNLVKIDLDGNIIGESDWPVNPAGLVIHSAIHAARSDAHCVMHTHTTEGMAVACLEDGLTGDNFYSAIIHGRIAYHDFEGVTTSDEEKPRLVAALGRKNFAILRNHGLLTCGVNPADAFQRMWNMQRACEVQLATQQAGQKIRPIPNQIRETSAARAGSLEGKGKSSNDRVFQALIREIDRIDPSYRN